MKIKNIQKYQILCFRNALRVLDFKESLFLVYNLTVGRIENHFRLLKLHSEKEYLKLLQLKFRNILKF